MTTNAKDNLLDWLRDAHAMEMQAETMLKAQASRLEHYPDLQRRIEQHITETQGQAQALQSRIEALGSDTSAMKDMGGKAMAAMQGFGGMFATDEVIKGSMASYAFEHFEMSAYLALIEAARVVGDAETERVCQDILQQEKDMAQWLEQNLPATTRRFLELDATPHETAKR